MSKSKLLPPLDVPYLDMFGQRIKVGAYIVYGSVDGRSGTLRAGQVIALSRSQPRWEGDTKDAEPKIFTKSWSNFKAGDWTENKSGRQKNVSLGFLDRLVVVPDSVVGGRVKKDLAGPAYNWNGTPIKSTVEGQ